MKGRVNVGLATADQLPQLLRIHSEQGAAQVVPQRVPRLLVYDQRVGKPTAVADLLRENRFQLVMATPCCQMLSSHRMAWFKKENTFVNLPINSPFLYLKNKDVNFQDMQLLRDERCGVLKRTPVGGVPRE
jgi:hypothetical protein